MEMAVARFMPVKINQEYLESEEYAQDILLDIENTGIASLLAIDTRIKDILINNINNFELGGMYGLGISAATNMLKRELMAAARSALYTGHPLRVKALQDLIKEQQETTRLLMSWQFVMLGVMQGYEAMGLATEDISWFDVELELASAYNQLLNRLGAVVTAGAITGITIGELKRNVAGIFDSREKSTMLITFAVAGRQAAAIARRVSFSKMFFQHQDSFSGYMWLTMQDERVCNVCRPLHGKVFRLGEGEMPPAHMNCRCTTIAMPLPGVIPHSSPWESFPDWLGQMGL
jgi:SPP1 gp7 family putative phage head morphogenesis protein